MTETINQRFLAVIDDIQSHHLCSFSTIERECSIGKILANIRLRNLVPSSSTIASVISRYPSYSAEWILTGRGNMHYSETDSDLSVRYQRLLDLNLKLQERLDR